MAPIQTADAPSFYVIGGTLSQQAASYVTRDADERLFEGLQHGEFCYVLTARQMGKSSLMVRTAQRLRAAGDTVAILDLTAIGQNLSPEQWYYGLLNQLTRQLGERQRVRAAWTENEDLSPLQRWLQILQEIILPLAPQSLIVFIDEIDTVRSLPFATDEFFAGIRELYNARTERPALNRLSFCLLGVATPSDLIRDMRLTPFNIGQRIELNDFTEKEALWLARGLQQSEATREQLLARVIHWTGGHPYLTQRLCLALFESNAATTDDVDQLCQSLFLAPSARERDDNLLFVRERLLRSEVDVGSLLLLYGRIRKGDRVRDDESNPLVTVLRLAGITRPQLNAAGERLLTVRNRVYAHVFSDAWIEAQMPDAERQRQRAEYRRNLIRLGSLATAIICVIAAFAVMAFIQRNRAEAQQRAKESLLYTAQMNLIAQSWEDNNLSRVNELLDTQRPTQGATDLRRFEWFYFQQLAHGEEESRNLDALVRHLAFTPDGKTLAVATQGKAGQLHLLRASDWQPYFSAPMYEGALLGLACSPNNQTVAIASDKGKITLRDLTTGAIRQEWTAHTGIIRDLAYAPDGRWLASCGDDKTIKLWNATDGREIATLSGHQSWIWSIAVSPDGRWLLSASEDGTAKLWDVAARRVIHTFNEHTASVYAAAYSNDGKLLVTAGNDNHILLWDAATRQLLRKLTGHLAAIVAVQFTSDGRQLVSASLDSTVRLWDVATGAETRSFKGHTDRVWSLSLSPDGQHLFSGGQDQMFKRWRMPQPEPQPESYQGKRPRLYTINYLPNGFYAAIGNNVARFTEPRTGWPMVMQPAASFSSHSEDINELLPAPDGRAFATASDDGTIKLWEANTDALLRTFQGHSDRVRKLVFSPDGRQIVGGGGGKDNSVIIWDTQTGKVLQTLRHHTRSVKGLAYTSDGHRFITASDDQTIWVFDTTTWQPIKHWLAHEDSIFSFALSPDGQSLATGSLDRTIKLWRLADFSLMTTLRGHTAEVSALTFSPDSQRLVSGSRDQSVKFWDLPNRQELFTRHRLGDTITALNFSPNGQQLAIAIRNGKLEIWEAPTTSPAIAP